MIDHLTSNEEFRDEIVEVSVLSFLYHHPSFVMDTNFLLYNNDFTSEENKTIFQQLYKAVDGAGEAGGNFTLLLKEEFSISDEKLYDLCKEDTKESFEYNYKKLKKFTILREFTQLGFDTSHFSRYNFDTNDKNYINIDEIDSEDIINYFKSKVNDVEEKFRNRNTERGISVFDGLEELVQQFELEPAVGVPLAGKYYNTATTGAIPGKMYLTSSPSGQGKTRRLVGQACALSLPYINSEGKIVVKQNDNYYPTLYIATEQQVTEIQTLVLACVSGVSEERIKLYQGSLTQDEKQRISAAIAIIKACRNNFFIEQIADPSIGEVRTKILQYIYKKNVSYVFYDYIFTSPSLLEEFHTSKLREDVVLLMMTNALKEIASVHNIFLMSATQMSGEYNKPCFRDARYVRGSKAIIDKVDVADCTVRVSPEEREMIKGITDTIGIVPNIVKDIHKNRAGSITQVKLFSFFDFATCRMKDLFITDDSWNSYPTNELQIYKQAENIYDYEDGIEVLKLYNENDDCIIGDNNG